MRNIVLGVIVIGLSGIGCNSMKMHCRSGEEASSTACNAPGGCSTQAPCPQVEVRPAKEIHVTAPAPKVVVESAPTAPCAPAAPAAPAAAPQGAPASPASVPATMQGVPVQTMSTPTAQTSMLTTTTQTTSPPRARLTLGFDVVRIPIPVLRFFALPGEQEVVTRTAYAGVPQSGAAPATVTTSQQFQVVSQAAVAQTPTYGVAAVPQVAVVPAAAVAGFPQAMPAGPAAAPAATAARQECQPPATREQMESLTLKLRMLEQSLNERTANPACAPK